MLVAIEEDVLIDLVRVDARLRRGLPADDVGDLRQLPGRDDTTGRVGGEVEDDDTGASGDQRREFAPGEAEIGRLAQVQWHRLGAEVGGEGFVDREAGARIDDLVAGIAVGLLRQPDGGLAAREDHDTIGRDRNAAPGRHGAGDGLAQRQDALWIAVMRQVEIDLPLHLVGNMLGEREIGFAEIAFDDLEAAGFELADLGADPEGVLAADEPGAPGEKTGGQLDRNRRNNLKFFGQGGEEDNTHGFGAMVGRRGWSGNAGCLPFSPKRPSPTRQRLAKGPRFLPGALSPLGVEGDKASAGLTPRRAAEEHA